MPNKPETACCVFSYIQKFESSKTLVRIGIWTVFHPAKWAIGPLFSDLARSENNALKSMKRPCTGRFALGRKRSGKVGKNFSLCGRFSKRPIFFALVFYSEIVERSLVLLWYHSRSPSRRHSCQWCSSRRCSVSVRASGGCPLCGLSFRSGKCKHSFWKSQINPSLFFWVYVTHETITASCVASAKYEPTSFYRNNCQ